MKTFKQYIKESERYRLNTVMDTNVRNRIAGIKRSVDFSAGDPSKLNFPKNTVGQLSKPAKPKLKSITPNMGVGRSDTPVGSMPKAKTNTIPSSTGIGRSDTPVGSMPKAKLPSVPSSTGIGRSNTPVGSMPKAKTKDYSGMKDAWEKNDRFPGEGGTGLSFLPKGDKASDTQKSLRQFYGKKEIADRIKDRPQSQPVYRDPPEKLKKDAEMTWNIKAREPKDSNFSKMYAGGSVEDRIDISSPEETLSSYMKRRKSDTDKWYIPKKKKDIDLLAARGYDLAKDPKTGLSDIKREKNPKLLGSYAPWSGRLQVRKDAERGPSTTAHEFGHKGSTYYQRKSDHDSEEMRQRELDARKNTEATSDAKEWWKRLYRGENPRDRLRLFKPTSSSDTPHQPKNRGYDPRHVDPMGFTYPRSEKQVKKDQIFKGLGDRDRISIERLNDRMLDKSRKDLSQKYFRGGRESHTDDDLISAAFGSTLPDANKMRDDKIDNKTGNPNQLRFPKTSASLKKADAIKQQKDIADLGHFSTRKKVFKRNFDVNFDVNKDNSNLRYPEFETGNPNQLNFPKGKK